MMIESVIWAWKYKKYNFGIVNNGLMQRKIACNPLKYLPTLIVLFIF